MSASGLCRRAGVCDSCAATRRGIASRGRTAPGGTCGRGRRALETILRPFRDPVGARPAASGLPGDRLRLGDGRQHDDAVLVALALADGEWLRSRSTSSPRQWQHSMRRSPARYISRAISRTARWWAVGQAVEERGDFVTREDDREPAVAAHGVEVAGRDAERRVEEEEGGEGGLWRWRRAPDGQVGEQRLDLGALSRRDDGSRRAACGSGCIARPSGRSTLRCGSRGAERGGRVGPDRGASRESPVAGPWRFFWDYLAPREASGLRTRLAGILHFLIPYPERGDRSTKIQVHSGMFQGD